MWPTLLLSAVAAGSPCGSAAVCGLPASQAVVVRSVPKVVQSVPVVKSAVTVQQPAVFYGVGQTLREETLLRLLIREELSKALGGAKPTTSNAVDSPLQPTPAALTQHCGKCHLGDQTRGGLSLDGVLEPGVALEAIRQMAEGTMPPGQKLDRETKNQLLAELLGKGK